MEDFPFELILFFIAALIGIGKRIVDAGKKVREKSRKMEADRHGETGVRLEELEAPRPPVEQRVPEPQPATRDPLRPPYGDMVETALGTPVTSLPVPAVRRVPAVPPRRRERQERPAPAPAPVVVSAAQLEAARRALKKRLADESRPVRKTRVRQKRIVAMLHGSPREVRDAIVLKEILGPPVALRGRKNRRF